MGQTYICEIEFNIGQSKSSFFIDDEIKCKHKAIDCTLSLKIPSTMRWIQNNTKPRLFQNSFLNNIFCTLHKMSKDTAMSWFI